MASKPGLSDTRHFSRKQHSEIFDDLCRKVTVNFFDPDFSQTNWPGLTRLYQEEILAAEDTASFELRMNGLVQRLGSSRFGFFHKSRTRIPTTLAMGATFSETRLKGQTLWIARDVHEGGRTAIAGLKPGDILRSINGQLVHPPTRPAVQVNQDLCLVVERGGGQLRVWIDAADSAALTALRFAPRPITARLLEANLGYLKVTHLPGLAGLNVCREIDNAILQLSSCRGLIIDLRGHFGGGLGVLRLMSHLTPESIPIGYMVSRARAEIGYRRQDLPKLNRLPTHWPNVVAMIWLALRVASDDESYLLISEGLRPHHFHGNIAILVNEHTTGAGEIAAAFAREHQLASIIGKTTAGGLNPCSSIGIEKGYRLVIPRSEYVTWKGHRLEGIGVTPTVPVENPFPEADLELKIARQTLT